jgi:hypothetical protein
MFALTGSEDVAASIAASSELCIIAVAAVDLIGLGAELLIHQRDMALVAQEADLVPVFVFVGQVLKQTCHLQVKMLRTIHEEWLGRHLQVMLRTQRNNPHEE